MKWEYGAVSHECKEPLDPDPRELWRTSDNENPTWNKIKDYGERGWELVNVVYSSSIHTPHYAGTVETDKAYYLFVFKRLVDDPK